jgi:ribose transport system permease protein
MKSLLARLPRIALLALALVPVATTPYFLSAGNLKDILDLASLIGVLAVGQTFVLIAGGFDLSQGSALCLTAAMTAWLLERIAPTGGLAPWLAASAALGVGAALGTINGLCVAGLGTNPFVTTLSTLLIFRGAAFVLLGGEPIRGVSAFAALDQWGPRHGATLLPLRALAFPAAAFLAWLALRQTVFGQHIYATGGNAGAARLAGVRTARARVAAFALSGLSAGLAALLLLSWIRVAKPETGAGYELDSIAACVVGGVSLQGGSGSVLGAAAGCLLLRALAQWITLSGFPDEYRSLVTGAVILTFAAVDAWSRRRPPG